MGVLSLERSTDDLVIDHGETLGEVGLGHEDVVVAAPAVATADGLADGENVIVRRTVRAVGEDEHSCEEEEEECVFHSCRRLSK